MSNFVRNYYFQSAGATLANGTVELKELIKSKGEGKYFISNGSVDENGILAILKHFIV